VVIFLITGFLITSSVAGMGDKDADATENNKNIVTISNPLLNIVQKIPKTEPKIEAKPIEIAKEIPRDLEKEVLLNKIKNSVGIVVGNIDPKQSTIKVTEQEKELQAKKPKPVKAKNLDDILPRPDTATRINYVEYPSYNIVSPLLYAQIDDLISQDTNGNLVAKEQEDPKTSPVQKLLENGVVHIGYTPMPGELGNCYIVGHSSNYASVKSSYNKIFAPIERKSKVGEEFYVYDQVGRKLRFVVFETLRIEAANSQEAFKEYPDERVCTLQTSIVSTKNGKTAAYERWLTRGKLVLE
jgi:sortase (surface protein transpeptidase)